MQPIRVQRKRGKGWRMPENTVYVGRPTAWGNPFMLWPQYRFNNDPEVVLVRSREDAVARFRKRMEQNKAFRPDLFELFIKRLRGKNLACYCELDQPCHADVLLEMANESDGRPIRKIHSA